MCGMGKGGLSSRPNEFSIILFDQETETVMSIARDCLTAVVTAICAVVPGR